MNTTVGTKGIIWGSIGAELQMVVYDLRYMVICSIALILTDLWWGYSESKLRKREAEEIGNATLVEKFKWHKSRAGRRTANKIVDYLTYLVVGALVGLAITEPMDICNHIWSAAIGLGIGCACEIASIIGHIAYVKLGVEISLIDGWRAFVRFFGKLIKVKSQEIGDAVEDLGRDGRHHHHEHGPEFYDNEQNMED
ncbi:MAG: hypothetical protein IJR71_00375 [Prevotella sp.]|nr:hypothetical protein [Prevotella sp.]